ncbi:hypothetical protein NLU13_2630 [Sarocladium strictum]|uniref:Mid2 domain-containing protein n=1 Tax=Sarocladium strictum TaxID=5046 RepID=A0AA39GLC8_SARSR|nr:hypothetical protein NLU13_2630 [Sarocladium strictum]
MVVSGVKLGVALGLFLATVTATEEYVPMHKRNSFDTLVDDFTYLGMLSRRDVCSDAFGDDAERATCVPSFTLCCIRKSQSFPSCQQYLGKGWCCVGENNKDSCYVDQESACTEENAVECANLQEGTDRACCPRFTTCDSTVAASEEYVRCNINQGDLKSFHSASIASTATSRSTSEATTETSSTSSSSSLSSRPTKDNDEDKEEKTENTQEGDSNELSTGAIAGIAVGGVVALSLAGAVLWLFLRRRKGGNYQAAQQDPQPTIPQFYQEQQMKYHAGTQGPYDPVHLGPDIPDTGYSHGLNSPPLSELQGHNRAAAELDTGR